ncbi:MULTISPECIES: dienelactone hydrolase family protein [Ramlibacter]|uniref:Dienelactone hydrolase family protein n=1 Tax=Ramlibacter aquaticus TaxID=2780094 RepID=A0ABR9SGZ7_9BURK|nr:MULTISPECIES: dienelactone hydrolase family protein [Ramlibacter]MBE7941626.1 dienelactone hydrolase family protein [Ramlibacter aquaticus]
MRAVLLCLLLALVLPTARAQAPATLQQAAQAAPDLQYPRESSTFSLFTSPEMALYKPEGTGPFPALVLMHQCGGLRNPRSNWQNLAVLQWAREGVAHGYVVLVVDSLGPRNAATVCLGPSNGVNFPRGVRDALMAGRHLASLPYVDAQRIGVAGFSWGAMVSVLASSPSWAQPLAEDGFRFRAAAALYPGCFTVRPRDGRPYEILNPDIDRPLLMLMGGQDTETPAADCASRLEAMPAAPVTRHLYPDATHCWDCKNLNNFSKVDVRGSQVVYHYSEETTHDSETRVFEFFARQMPPAR